MKSKILKDEIRFLVFSEIYLRFDDPAKRRKAFSILETTISLLDRKGFDGVSLEMVARETGLSRPTIRLYFENLDKLQLLAVRYVRLLFQKNVVDAMVKEETEPAMIKRYIRSCFDWVEQSRTHANVWLAFLNQCVRRPKLREINTLAVTAGEERIIKILELGQKNGFFHFDDSRQAAKGLQTLLMGSMIGYASEDHADLPGYREAMMKSCLRLLGA